MHNEGKMLLGKN